MFPDLSSYSNPPLEPPVHCCAASESPGAPPAPESVRLLDEVRHLSRTWTGQSFRLPEPHVAIVTPMTIRPGTQLPVHLHPFPRFGWVEQGAIRVVQVESGLARVFRAGELITESIGQHHYGEVVGKEAAVLKILDVVPPGMTSNTVLRDAGSATSTPHDVCHAFQAMFQ
ncbi:cupin domain-containing protein [Roseateles sp.]|uniref:cupin domain-containing protein n=1 Tax=Roseateles sp. TaxID=1971397 RepID=UPI002F41DF1B